MRNKNKIIEKLSEELTNVKETRITVRITEDLHQRLIEHKEATSVSISDIVRISLLNYFENEVNN